MQAIGGRIKDVLVIVSRAREEKQANGIRVRGYNRDRQARELVRPLSPFENSQNVEMIFPWTLPRFGNSRNVEMTIG
jgi:hypothetical protein